MHARGRCGWVMTWVGVAIALAGCSAYHPFDGQTGFAEAPISSNAYEVTFTGSEDWPLDKTQRYAMNRAAEITLDQDWRYFQIESGVKQIVRQQVFVPTQYQPTTAWFTDHYGHVHPVDVETVIPAHYEVEDRPVVRLRVQLVDKPAANTFDAQAIVREAATKDHVKFDKITRYKAGLPE